MASFLNRSGRWSRVDPHSDQPDRRAARGPAARGLRADAVAPGGRGRGPSGQRPDRANRTGAAGTDRRDDRPAGAGRGRSDGRREGRGDRCRRSDLSCRSPRRGRARNVRPDDPRRPRPPDGADRAPHPRAARPLRRPPGAFGRAVPRDPAGPAAGQRAGAGPRQRPADRLRRRHRAGKLRPRRVGRSRGGGPGRGGRTPPRRVRRHLGGESCGEPGLAEPLHRPDRRA